jgi:hypothetical protein
MVVIHVNGCLVAKFRQADRALAILFFAHLVYTGIINAVSEFPLMDEMVLRHTAMAPRIEAI